MVQNKIKKTLNKDGSVRKTKKSVMELRKPNYQVKFHGGPILQVGTYLTVLDTGAIENTRQVCKKPKAPVKIFSGRVSEFDMKIYRGRLCTMTFKLVKRIKIVKKKRINQVDPNDDPDLMVCLNENGVSDGKSRID